MTISGREIARRRADHSAFVIRYLSFASAFGFGLAQAGDAIAFFPLAAFFEQRDAFKAFQHVPLAAEDGRRAQTTMLRHKSNPASVALLARFLF
jgi:hypothetical protein